MSLKRFASGKLLFFLCALLMAGVIILFFGADRDVNNTNLELIRSHGWQVEAEPKEISHLTIPSAFDSVFDAYNRVIGGAGFDLTPYQGVRATRYTYQVQNHEDSAGGMVVIHVFVTKNRVIAADITSLAKDGFLRPINDTLGQIRE